MAHGYWLEAQTFSLFWPAWPKIEQKDQNALCYSLDLIMLVNSNITLLYGNKNYLSHFERITLYFTMLLSYFVNQNCSRNKIVIWCVLLCELYPITN